MLITLIMNLTRSYLTITNNGDEDIIIEKGQHFIQGVIINYFITEDDETSTLRTGGIGSTNK